MLVKSRMVKERGIARHNIPIVGILSILVPQVADLVVCQLSIKAFLEGLRDLFVEQILEHKIQSEADLFGFVNRLASHGEQGAIAK